MAKSYFRKDPFDLWGILSKHQGHHVVIAKYGDSEATEDVCLECEDCFEILLDAELYNIFPRH